MNKKLLCLFAMLMVALSISAIPAKPGQWKNITLSDGSTVKVQLIGDEFLHFWRSVDGNCYREDSTGTYQPITDMATRVSKAKAARVKVNTARMAITRAPIDGTIRTYSGTKKGLVILVQFADTKFQLGDDQALYKRILNESGYSQGNFKGSVSDYFKAQSYNTFELDFDVAGPYTLSNNVAYYGKHSGQDNDANPGAMVKEACNDADKDVNFADYDWDGDGEVDQVFVVYAGLGEANGGSADTIWPHEWDLYSATGSNLTLDGKTVSTYACGAELQPGTSGNVIDGIGTICHEFSHCLGFPDMYDTDYSGGNGMYLWDLMDTGSYLGNGYQPCGYTSYERMLAGWLKPTELNSADKSVTKMKALTDSAEAYIIYNQGHKDEYYLLENRQKTGWDSSLCGKGLLVLHVDYDKNEWSYNAVNDDPSHQRLTPIPADGSTNYTTTYQGTTYLSAALVATDTYPYNTLDSLTNNSSPAATLYNANSNGSKFMNHGIFGITQNSDNTISFNYKANVAAHVGKNKAGEVLLYESFDKCDGTGGNDSIWGGDYTVGNATFNPDLTGWDSDIKYGANKCARFGSSKLAGSATTPSFTLDGSATLSFKVAPWYTGSSQDGVAVTVTLGDTKVKDFSLKASTWKDYSVTISGSGSYKLTFTAAKGRFFLDEVKVYVPDESTDAIKEIKASKPFLDGKIYNINGQYVGTDMDALPRGIYIQNGRKILK
jgi:immune inhibitor A